LPDQETAAEILRVVGFDVDANRVKLLEAGESPVEDVGDDRLRVAGVCLHYGGDADVARSLHEAQPYTGWAGFVESANTRETYTLQATLAARLGLGDSCRLLGNRTDIADLHHTFDVFVQSSDYEGTPNAVLEAMAFESPVVATSAGGTAEIVRDGIDGLIVPIGDVGAIGGAVRTVLHDPFAARARATSARRRVETDLSFETRMAAVEAIYVDLFQQRSGADASRLVTAGT
jgi:glycosyltransferase involved in cell wall biosynthesis